jgi:hypothetical protein
VTRCDGGGGFSVIETDNAENLLHDLSICGPLIDFQIADRITRVPQLMGT